MIVGQRVRGKVVKNKVAPPFRLAEFDMMHTNGISYEGDILDLAMQHNLITRSGTWFRYGDEQLGQGREKARTYLKDNPEFTKRLHQEVLVAGGYHDLLPEGTADPSAEAEDKLSTV